MPKLAEFTATFGAGSSASAWLDVSDVEDVTIHAYWGSLASVPSGSLAVEGSSDLSTTHQVPLGDESSLRRVSSAAFTVGTQWDGNASADGAVMLTYKNLPPYIQVVLNATLAGAGSGAMTVIVSGKVR